MLYVPALHSRKVDIRLLIILGAIYAISLIDRTSESIAFVSVGCWTPHARIIIHYYSYTRHCAGLCVLGAL